MWYELMIKTLLYKIVLRDQFQAAFFIKDSFKEIQKSSVDENKYHNKKIWIKVKQLLDDFKYEGYDFKHNNLNKRKGLLSLVYYYVATHYLPKADVISHIKLISQSLAYDKPRQLELQQLINKLRELPQPLVIPSEILLGLIDKMFLIYRDKPDNSIELKDFIRDLYSLTLVYTKAGFETNTYYTSFSVSYHKSAFNLMGYHDLNISPDFLNYNEISRIHSLERDTLQHLDYNVDINFEHLFHLFVSSKTMFDFSKILTFDLKYILRKDDCICNLLVKIEIYRQIKQQCRQSATLLNDIGLRSEAKFIFALIKSIKYGIGHYDNGRENYHETRSNLQALSTQYIKLYYFNLIRTAIENLCPITWFDMVAQSLKPLLSDKPEFKPVNAKIRRLQASLLYKILQALNHQPSHNRVLGNLITSIKQHIENYLEDETNNSAGLNRFKQNCLTSIGFAKTLAKGNMHLNSLAFAVNAFGNANFAQYRLFSPANSSSQTTVKTTTQRQRLALSAG